MSIETSQLLAVPEWMIWVSIIGPFVGTLLGGMITLAANRQNIKAQEEKHNRDLEAQEQKHRKDLLVQIALEDYKQSWNLAISRGGMTMPPIEVFILHMNTLANAILSEKSISENEYIELLKKSEALINAHRNYKQQESES